MQVEDVWEAGAPLSSRPSQAQLSDHAHLHACTFINLGVPLLLATDQTAERDDCLWGGREGNQTKTGQATLMQVSSTESQCKTG